MASLNDNALTTLSVAKGELGSTSASDDQIRRWINEASDLLERQCNRRFYHATEHVERVSGYAGHTLLVSDHVPVDQIREIVYDTGTTTETVDASDYEVIESDKGKIRRKQGEWRDTRARRTEIDTTLVPGTDQPLYRITYDGGYVTPEQAANSQSLDRDLPHQIERAVLKFVAMRNAQAGNNPNVEDVSMSNADISYVTTDDGRLPTRPKAIDHVIQSYIDRPLA